MKPVKFIEWIKQSEKDFKPPVCNKLLYEEQLKVMVVGGPNERRDYHLEEGEEIFYMIKGDMCLKIMELGKPKDVIIKEGEIFILPARIPHSPQRTANSLGLVIERDRVSSEMDGLRFYVDNGNKEVLYERWFHCTDLGKQLKPVIEEYFTSDCFKTRKPTKDSVKKHPSFVEDSITEIQTPIQFSELIKDSVPEGKVDFKVSMFPSHQGESKVILVGGKAQEETKEAETFVWQKIGSANLLVGGESVEMKEGEVLLIPVGVSFSSERKQGNLGLEISISPKKGGK